MQRTFSWFFTAVVLWGPLAAQEPAIPDSGSRVRVWTAARRATGELVRLSADSVVLKPSDARPLRAWPRETVDRLEVSRGRRGHFWLGLGIGAGVGLLAGGIVAGASSDQLGAGGTGAIVWAASTVLGGTVGAMVRTERWGRAAWPQVERESEAVAQSSLPPE